MYIYVNEVYFELFGYEDVDDLEGMFIMDMVLFKDYEEFKQFLCVYSVGESDINEFLCYGFCIDGIEI